jgi:hypothetical protein
MSTQLGLGTAESVGARVELAGPDWEVLTTMSVPKGPVRLVGLLPLVQSFGDAVVASAAKVTKAEEVYGSGPSTPLVLLLAARAAVAPGASRTDQRPAAWGWNGFQPWLSACRLLRRRTR